MPTLSRTVPLSFSTTAERGRRGGLVLVQAGGQPVLPADGLYAELEVRIAGRPDPRTGYIVSISAVDGAVRERLPALLAEIEPAPPRDERAWLELLRRLAHSIGDSLGGSLRSLHLRLTPYHRLALEVSMTAPDTASITRRFDFCAAHRLHLPELSDAENLALFGKCSHPSGHGHNYRLDVTVAASSTPSAGAASPVGSASGSPGIETWSEIVRREIVDRYDHRNLNIDCPEFRTLNPSVENIARVCHDRLLEPLRQAGVRLGRVRVWESEKTWCEVP